MGPLQVSDQPGLETIIKALNFITFLLCIVNYNRLTKLLYRRGFFWGGIYYNKQKRKLNSQFSVTTMFLKGLRRAYSLT